MSGLHGCPFAYMCERGPSLSQNVDSWRPVRHWNWIIAKGICVNILILFVYALNYKPSKILYSKDRLYIHTYFMKCFLTYLNIVFLHTFFFSMTICWIYGKVRLVWVWTCSKLKSRFSQRIMLFTGLGHSTKRGIDKIQITSLKILNQCHSIVA